MRCKHDNFVLSEHVSVATGFHFTKGMPPKGGIGWHDEARPTGEITVTCKDCDLSKRYKRLDLAPRWIQDAWGRLMESQYPTCNPNIEEAQ